MKKILLVALMALVGLSASAQLKVKRETQHPTTISSWGITTRHPAKMYRAEDGHIFMSIGSSNQFDEPFLFFLGENDQEAVQTLLDIEALYKKKKSTTVVQNYGEECRIYYWGTGNLGFKQTGYAGEILLFKSACQKFILDIGKD
ncbi:MAG: hypothetical protein NC115_12970 [Bacteroidales bacterium]|nr:hypothetical protein [Bacteroides sp.]MCM1422152.1 hypothetical protein [Bacteroides sp.]MCM1503554.1 hypothetical protein [Bacteroidales bacterium]